MGVVYALGHRTMVAAAAAIFGACLSSPPVQSTDGGSDDTTDAAAAGDLPLLLYLFDEAGGTTVFDQSDMAPAVDLHVTNIDAVMWNDDSLTLSSPTRLSGITLPLELIEACKQSNELTAEAWVSTPHVLQPAELSPQRILSLSEDSSSSNFILGQHQDRWITRLRTDETDANGSPLVMSTSVVQADSLTHIVFTRSDSGLDSLYINGQISAIGEARVGTLGSWGTSFPLTVGNEPNDERAWLGDIHAIAVYARALADDEVLGRFQAGPP